LENQEHPKNCEDFGKIKKEDSKGLRRVYKKEEFCSLVPRQFIWKKTSKTTEKQRKLGPEHTSMRLGHVLCVICF